MFDETKLIKSEVGVVTNDIIDYPYLRRFIENFGIEFILKTGLFDSLETKLLAVEIFKPNLTTDKDGNKKIVFDNDEKKYFSGEFLVEEYEDGIDAPYQIHGILHICDKHYTIWANRDLISIDEFSQKDWDNYNIYREYVKENHDFKEDDQSIARTPGFTPNRQWRVETKEEEKNNQFERIYRALEKVATEVYNSSMENNHLVKGNGTK